MANAVSTASAQVISAYKAAKEGLEGGTSKENGGFMSHVFTNPLKNAIKAVHFEEKGISDNLEGKISEDELAMLINQADLYLKEFKAICDRVVEVNRQISQAGG